MWSHFYGYNTIVSDFPDFWETKRIHKQRIPGSLFPPPTETPGTKLDNPVLQTGLLDLYRASTCFLGVKTGLQQFYKLSIGFPAVQN